MFRWKTRDQGTKIATIYETNITLNKAASIHFLHAYSVLLGLDESHSRLAIKPLNKQETERGDIPEEKLYRVSVRSSYTRISNKTFITYLSQHVTFNFEDNAMVKFKAEWNDAENSLIIDLKKPEEGLNNGNE